jgi:uncharacterized delta-60 repeat protein
MLLPGAARAQSALDGFDPGANGKADAIAVQADGKILVGGDFTMLGGGGTGTTTRNRIGRLNADGTLDTSFDPGANTFVDAIAVQTDGKILVGGFFTMLGGGTGTTQRNRIGRLNADGSLDTSFDPGANNNVFAIAVQADGKILAGGFFTMLGGGGTGMTTRNQIGRLTNTDAALQNLSVSSNGNILWQRSGASPEVDRVSFEQSSDGANYTALGGGTRISSGWQLTGLSLPLAQNLFLRARGFYQTGEFDGSASIVESVREVFIPSAVQFSQAAYSVQEGCATATITVNRMGSTSGTVSVDFATSDGTALQRTNYTLATGTLTFGDGVSSQNFNVLITKDAYRENPNASLNLSLGNATGGAVLGAQSTATLTIMDDATVPTNSQPIDDAGTFVCQHYHDFLSREPDQAGFAFWVSQITQCGSDQTCINRKRIDVSNAFFFEVEYQQTAAYVFRLWREAYGNSQPFPNPDNSNPTEANKLPSYAVFSKDWARLIGSSNLAQDQLALATLFASRPEFLDKYPANLTLDQFVDAVLATIQAADGVDLTSQRSGLIALGSRGAVMYRLANDDGSGTNGGISNRPFIDAEYNRAFVYSQYAGYLRRDADIGGFLFWLGQVGACPLRNVGAQHAMVCSFITSAEYQNRFSAAVTHSDNECPQGVVCSP